MDSARIETQHGLLTKCRIKIRSYTTAFSGTLHRNSSGPTRDQSHNPLRVFVSTRHMWEWLKSSEELAHTGSLQTIT